MKQIKFQNIHNKVLSKSFIPFYCLISILLILGIPCLHGYLINIDSSTLTGSQSVTKNTNESDFNSFLHKLFQNEVTSNTLNLHYTLSDPGSMDITQYPVTFGEISTENETSQLAALENLKSELQTYDPSSMSLSSQLTYDVLENTITLELEKAPFYYYDEILSSTNGIQSEYPILLAEYTFHSKKDIEDYLTLLSQYDTFLAQAAEFEKQKSKRGLFMNETAADNLIKQCRAFLPEQSEQSFWETTFLERLNEMDSLSKKEKSSYIKQNQTALQEHVYPAFHSLIAVLKALKKSGKNSQGLCHFENGQKYYQLLVKSTTGSGHSIPELQKIVESRRERNLAELSLLFSKSAASHNIKRSNEEVISAVSSSVALLPYKTPEDMLERLKVEIQSAFPDAPSTNYTVKEVSKKLEDFLSPAFYLTAPMDQYIENCIYINPSSNYDEIELFTTLAHEGYPGHLYQTVYSYSASLQPIRYLLYHGGYTEGWATYVEMLSYDYTGLGKQEARALMLNRDSTLSLYASIDMGVHYDGWSLADTSSFLGSYGITDMSVISDIYQAVIENPANYLKYYIGYLEFLDLKEQAKTYYRNDYSDLLFHTAVLDMGSAPFYILEKYFTKYYGAAD